MSLCFFLKILGELSLYFCVINAVLSIALTGVETLIPLFIMAAVATMAYWLDDKHPDKRFFLLPLLGAVLFFGSGFSYYFAVGLPSLYVALIVIGQRYYLDHDSQADFFRTGIAAATFLVLTFALVLGLDHIIPFAVLFMVSYIFMLRLLRQDAEIFNETKFRVLNLITVGAVILAALLLTSDAFMSLMSVTVVPLFYAIMQPVLYVFVWVGLGLFYGLNWFVAFIRSFMSGETVDQNELLNSGMNFLPEGFEQTDVVSNPNVVRLIQGGIVLVGVFLVVLWFLEGKKGKQKRSDGSIKESRTIVTDIRPEEKIYSDRFPPKEPRAAVRYYYRNFMRLCLELGYEFPRHFTSRHIQNVVAYRFDNEKLEALRQTYIRARYSDAEITKGDVKHIKEQVKNLKNDVSTDSIKTDDTMEYKLHHRLTDNNFETVGKGPGAPKYESNYQRK